MSQPFMPRRFDDWRDRLARFLDQQRMRPFAWGINDCAMFAGFAVQAMTGTNPLQQYVMAYSTEVGAARIIARGGGLLRIISEHMGPTIAPGLAADGDIGLLDTAQGETLALRLGVNWLGPAAGGIAALQIGGELAAWRVG